MSSKSSIKTFERVLQVLTVIAFYPIASTQDVKKYFPNLTLRTIQRYVKELERAGYVKRIRGDFSHADRLLLTEKSKRIVTKTGN